MKLILLALLPFVMSAPDRRFVLDTLGGSLCKWKLAFGQNLRLGELQKHVDSNGGSSTNKTCKERTKIRILI